MARFNSTSSSYSTYDAKKAAKKREDKTPAWQKYSMGTVGNFFDDLGDFATGFFPGMFEIGKSAVNDARVATGLSSGSYKLDDVADAIWEDYKYTYGPAFSGDFKEFGRRVHEHPLGPVLDVLALVTAGGGAAGKAGKIAAGSSGSAKGAKLAGLTATNRVLKAGEDVAEIAALKKRGGTIGPDGTVFEPKTLKFDAGLDVPFEVVAKNNPVKRGYQQAFGKIGSQPALRNVPGVGTAARKGRADRKLADRMIDREFQQKAGALTDLLAKYIKKPEEQAAVYLRATKMTPEDWTYAYQRQLSKLNDIDEFKGEGGEAALNAARTKIMERIKLFEDEGVRELWKNPTDEMNSVLDEMRKVEDAHTALLVKAAQAAGTDFSPEFRRSLEMSFVKGNDEAAKFREAVIAGDIKAKDAPIIFPHIAENQDFVRSLLGDARKASRSGSQRLNKGVNMRLAANSLDPRIMLTAYRDTLQSVSRMRNFEGMLEAAKVLEPGMELPAGYVRIKDVKAEKLRADVETVMDFMDEDLKVMAGDSIVAENAIAKVEDFYNKLTNEGGVLIVPEGYARHLTQNFANSKNFIVRFLKEGTDFWRYLTLPARPAWVMANYIGQMTFLLATHGLFKGVKNYIQVAKHGRLLDEFAPDVLSAGFVRSQALAAGKNLGKGDSLASRILKKIKKPVDSLANLNAILTDDIPRRAAFLAEIQGPTRQIMREHKVYDGLSEAQEAVKRAEAKLDDLRARQGSYSMAGESPEALSSSRFYHGTGKPDLSMDNLSAMGADLQGLFGPGIYLTDNPKIAAGYAKNRSKRSGEPSMYEAEVSAKKVLDMDAPADAEFAAILDKRAKQVSDAWDYPHDVSFRKMADDGATNAEMYKGFKEHISEISRDEGLPVYEFSESVHGVHEDLVSAGFDGITHVGGLRVGRGKDLHRVFISIGEADFAGEGRRGAIRRFDPYEHTDFADDIAAAEQELEAALSRVDAARAGGGRQPTFEEAAKMLLDEPGVVDELAAKVIDDLVDFRDLSVAERKYVRPFIPFYSWIKGATKRTARMTKDEPWKVAGGASIGQFGKENLEEQLGALPDYLYGIMPVGERDGDQQRVISAYSWNPFQTPGDVAGMAKNLAVEHRTGAENPMSSMNPFLKSAIEALTGEDIFYGTQLRDAENKSTARLYAERVRDSFPQVQAIKKSMRAGDERDYTPLFEPSALDQLLAYMGMPLKTVNVSTANQRADDRDKRKI